MALAVGRSAGLGRRLKRLLAVVPLALLVGTAPPNAAAQELEAGQPDKGRGAHVAQSSSTDNSTDNFVPSIEQLADITDPEHWDAEDLQELVDRYGCVAGFPDGTFKGEQPATRFEVATLIEACLDLGISIHEESTHVPSEPTPHPHEPAEHGHEGIVPHPHEPAEHEHDTVAEHEHPINLHILISLISIGVGIIAFMIHQYFILTKIRKLEKDVEKISQNRKPTSKDLIILATGIIGMIAASMPIIVHLLGVQGQEAGQRPVQQETARREDTDGLAIARRQARFLKDRLAVILSLPGRTVETRVTLSQDNTEKTPPPTPDNIWPGQTHSPSSVVLPMINGPPTG